MSDEYDDDTEYVELPDGSVVPGVELTDGWHLPTLGINVDTAGVPYSHETGEQLEWTEAEDPRLAEFAEAQARLEARIDEPREVIHTHRAEALSAPDVHAKWALEQEILQSPGAFDRPLTQRELAELGQESAEAGHYSLIQAAEARADRGQALRDVDSSHPGRAHQERVALAAELLDERSGTSADPITGERPRQAEQYDGTTHSGRLKMYEDALAGHDVAGRDTSSPSYPTTEDWQDDDAF